MRILIALSLFVASCGLFPDSETYRTDQCVNCEPDNTTSTAEVLAIFRS